VTAVDIVLGSAQTWEGLTEQGGENKGIVPKLCLADVGLAEGYPWCAAFVTHIGKRALWDYSAGKSTWPVLANGSCKALGQWASAKNILVDTPARGRIFLLYEPSLKRFGHTGFCLDETHTLEGNTNDDGSREGWKVCHKTRKWSVNDRFIDWAQLIK
jgi:hypothetical protein